MQNGKIFYFWKCPQSQHPLPDVEFTDQGSAQRRMICIEKTLKGALEIRTEEKCLDLSAPCQALVRETKTDDNLEDANTKFESQFDSGG